VNVANRRADPGDGRDSVLDVYRQFGMLDALRRVASSAAFLSGPIYPALARPMVWANERLMARRVLEGLLRGKRVLVLGSGPSANDLESIPDDVVVLTCKLGPAVLADKNLRRRLDLYYYPSLRIDGLGRERRQQLASLVRQVRIDLLVCENLLTLLDVLPMRAAYSRLVMDFTANQQMLRQLIAPTKIKDVRGRSFCPWTSTGVRLVQYAVHFGAREIFVIGIDLGKNGYASGGAMRRWHHEDIDRHVLRILSERHDHLYSLSANSPLAEYMPVRAWQADAARHAPRRSEHVNDREYRRGHLQSPRSRRQGDQQHSRERP
jgi:hypothetical protein